MGRLGASEVAIGRGNGTKRYKHCRGVNKDEEYRKGRDGRRNVRV